MTCTDDVASRCVKGGEWILVRSDLHSYGKINRQTGKGTNELGPLNAPGWAASIIRLRHRSVAQWDRRLEVGGSLTQNRLSVVADEGAARIDLHE